MCRLCFYRVIKWCFQDVQWALYTHHWMFWILNVSNALYHIWKQHIVPNKIFYFVLVYSKRSFVYLVQMGYVIIQEQAQILDKNKPRFWTTSMSYNYCTVGEDGVQWIRKMCCLITRNLQIGNPFHAKYMGMVIVYKQASLGFATTKRISVR